MSATNDGTGGGQQGLLVKMDGGQQVVLSPGEVLGLDGERPLRDVLGDLVSSKGQKLDTSSGFPSLEVRNVSGDAAAESGRPLDESTLLNVVQAEVRKGLTQLDARRPLVGGL